jgi:hypothetical protein
MDHQEILKGLGFQKEHENLDAGWERWRHQSSDAYDRDFALIIYKDYSLDVTLRAASKMLIKVGQKQKIDQISKYID